MVAGAGIVILGTLEGAAELLAAASAGAIFTGLVHGKTCIADDVAGKQSLRLLCAARVERDHAITAIDGFHGVVDRLDVIALVADKGAFVQW